MEDLDESGLRALRCIGISPSLVNNLVNSGTTLKEVIAEEIDSARTYRRAFAAFQLRDLCDPQDQHTVLGASWFCSKSGTDLSWICGWHDQTLRTNGLGYAGRSARTHGRQTPGRSPGRFARDGPNQTCHEWHGEDSMGKWAQECKSTVRGGSKRPGDGDDVGTEQ